MTTRRATTHRFFYLFRWNTDWCAQFDKSIVDDHTADDRITRVEDILGKNSQFAREDSEMTEFLLIFSLHAVAMSDEHVEQMINDVRLKDFHA